MNFKDVLAVFRWYLYLLRAASYLQREKEYLPISTGLHALAKIEAIVKRSPDYGAFQKFVRKVIGQQYQQAGGLSIKKIINGDNVNSVKLQVSYYTNFNFECFLWWST